MHLLTSTPNPSKNKEHQNTIIKILPLIAFAVPLALLYLLNPMDSYLKVSTQDSFQLMWKGRTFQLFFVWLVALEFILSWETIKLKINALNKSRAAAFALVLLLPTLYVLIEYYFGLNGATHPAVKFYRRLPVDRQPDIFDHLAGAHLNYKELLS